MQKELLQNKSELSNAEIFAAVALPAAAGCLWGFGWYKRISAWVEGCNKLFWSNIEDLELNGASDLSIICHGGLLGTGKDWIHICQILNEYGASAHLSGIPGYKDAEFGRHPDKVLEDIAAKILIQKSLGKKVVLAGFSTGGVATIAMLGSIKRLSDTIGQDCLPDAAVIIGAPVKLKGFFNTLLTQSSHKMHDKMPWLYKTICMVGFFNSLDWQHAKNCPPSDDDIGSMYRPIATPEDLKLLEDLRKIAEESFADVSCPVLFLSGDKDEYVHSTKLQDLLKKINNPMIEYFEFSGGHGDIRNPETAGYLSGVIMAWLEHNNIQAMLSNKISERLDTI